MESLGLNELMSNNLLYAFILASLRIQTWTMALEENTFIYVFSLATKFISPTLSIEDF